MRKTIVIFAVTVGVSSLLLVGAPAAAKARSHRRPAASAPHWESASGLFARRTSANRQMTKLHAKGFQGFTIERDQAKGSPRFEVEREFAMRAEADAEIARLRAAGFSASEEQS